MSTKRVNRYKKQAANLAAKTVTGQTTKPIFSVAEKSISRTRQDIKNWNEALDMARKDAEKKWYPLQLIYNEIIMDALLRSQIQNRINKSIAATFQFTDLNGTANEELTNLLQNATWVTDLNRYILQSGYYNHSLTEFRYINGVLQTVLIPRTNVEPVEGLFFADYSEDKFIKYREMKEYGSWILEFGTPGELGLLNNCIPHVLMKRFAQSCWSELCEIYGIPPRVMKTNTHDRTMVSRAEKMMKDMGAAAWFIIDGSEEFEFAKGVDTNGDVYKNLIQLCNNEMSMLIQGGVIGQDTANGNRSKEEVSQNLLADLVNSDLALLEQYWNSTVIPALQSIGVLPANIVFSYPKAKDLASLWKMTTEALQHYDVEPEWIADNFGIPVTPKKATAQTAPLSLSLGGDFFA